MTYIVLGQKPHYTDSLSQSIMFDHQTVLILKYIKQSSRYKAKSLDHQNIGHSDLHLFLGQTSGHTDS